MKNIFLAVILSVLALKSSAQNEQEIPNRYRYKYLGVSTNGTFRLPYGTTHSFTNDIDSTRPGALFYRTTDSSLLRWTGTQWLVVGGSGGGVSLSQMNDSLANYMKSIYRRSDSVFYRRGGVEVFAYKDSVGAGGSITSGNGVTISGGQANLGALTGNVNIDGTFDYQEGASTPLGNREIYASAIKLQAAGGASQFNMDGGGMSISGDLYAPGTGTLSDTTGYFPVLMNRSNGKFQKLPWSLLPSGGGGGLDSAGVRSIVSDSIKTMVSGDGILFEEITPDSVKVSVDTAWLNAQIDSALARGPKIWRGYITDYDSDSALIVQTNTLESNALVGWSFTKVPSTTGNYQFTFSSVYSSDKVNFLLSTFRSITNDVLVVPYALYDSGVGFIDIHTRDVGDNDVNIGTGQFDRLYLQITIEK